MLHIATGDSYMAGAEPMKGTCPVCLRKGNLLMGWVETECTQCRSRFCPDTLMRTVRLRRERLGMTIEEMAEAAGVKPSTVKQYENRWPSKRYWEATEKMIEGMEEGDD